jgi:hypothetical protein
MVVAAVTVHAPNGIWNQNGGVEFTVTNLAVARALAFVGPGTWSLAVWFHRRHHLPGTSAAAGLAGAPLLLGLLLAAAAAILSSWACCPPDRPRAGPVPGTVAVPSGQAMAGAGRPW